jgi:hypothetical protein
MRLLVFLSQVERLYQATTSSIADRFAQKEIDVYKHNANVS